ncbi:MAG: MmgE/PrpD family protein [Hyphomicrobiaceae bacterium]
MDYISTFAHHVVSTTFDELSDAAVSAAKTCISDTLGVGLLGSGGPLARELAAAQSLSGTGTDARVWSLGHRLPAPAAALCNAYQIHNSEYDCVHEKAVAHVLSAVLPASLAHCERRGNVSGEELITAVTLGVDVASSLGIASKSGLRFFRPGTVGAFGATAALGKLLNFDHDQMVSAFSLVYGQLCGTMQAHTEGSMLLALQMGFNARNSVVACDLTAAGFEGPKNVLEGQFGYFKLFETEGNLDAVCENLGHSWRICEVALKPFPTGRATHGLIDGCLTLQREHKISPDQILRVHAKVPPLVKHLVGRPPKPTMDINYARLCAAFVCARTLIAGGIDLDDFCAETYADEATRSLADRISIDVVDSGDPNALTPILVAIELSDGRLLETQVEDVYGHPHNPMKKKACIAKFRANCANAANPLTPDQIAFLIDELDQLEVQSDVTKLIDCMIG